MDLKTALRITREYDKLPETKGGQAAFLRSLYGERIKGRPVGEMSEGQIYSIANRAWSEATSLHAQYRALTGEPTGLESISTETLESWLEEAERESSVSDDQRIYPQPEVDRMGVELSRRAALAGMSRPYNE